MPQEVGKYTFVSKPKGELTNRFFSGIYTDGTEKVFIKTWSGTIHNYDYYMLVNEYAATQLLSRKLNNQNTVRVPRILHYHNTANTLSLVYEYIEGESVSSLPTESQVQVLTSIHSALASCTEALTRDERDILMQRTGLFYLFSFPSIFLLFCWQYPAYILTACRALIRSIPSIPHLLSEELVVSHRDITSKNILLNHSGAYLLDLEYVACAPKSLDQVLLVLNAESESIRERVTVLFSGEVNCFIKVWSILFALSDRSHEENVCRVYLSQLASPTKMST
jgi:serine/threonine protein kinase